MSRFFSLAVILVVLLSSCGNLKQLQYMQGNIDTAALSKINFVEPVIQEGDVLAIVVYSDNQLASSYYNQGSTVPSPGGAGALGLTNSAASTAGYEVNKEGNIQLYSLGQVPAKGLTRKQLADTLSRQYLERDLLKNPYVEVRFLNYKVTIVGDVTRPGVYTFPSEKVNILEALGYAGDLTNYAQRDNVLIIRESNNTRKFARLDLTNPNILASPYFYLQQNDMIIVDPNKSKATITDQSYRTISIATSIVSIVAIIISIFR